MDEGGDSRACRTRNSRTFTRNGPSRSSQIPSPAAGKVRKSHISAVTRLFARFSGLPFTTMASDPVEGTAGSRDSSEKGAVDRSKIKVRLVFSLKMEREEEIDEGEKRIRVRVSDRLGLRIRVSEIKGKAEEEEEEERRRRKRSDGSPWKSITRVRFELGLGLG